MNAVRDLRKRKSRWGDRVEGKKVGGVYVGIVCVGWWEVGVKEKDLAD